MMCTKMQFLKENMYKTAVPQRKYVQKCSSSKKICTKKINAVPQRKICTKK